MTEYDAAAEWWMFLNSFGMVAVVVLFTLALAGGSVWFISMIMEKQERKWYDN